MFVIIFIVVIIIISVIIIIVVVIGRSRHSAREANSICSHYLT